MNVTCPQCATVFRVDPAKVPERGVRARCSVCAGLIAVRRPPVAELAIPAPSVPIWTAEPPAARPAAPIVERPPVPSLPRTPVPTAPIAPAPMPPVFAPAPPIAPVPPPEPAPAPPPPVFAAERARPVTPAIAEPFVRPSSPPSVTFSALPTDSPAPGAPWAAAPKSVGSFTNPFLQQDPATRARRLARALISDLVVYHPEKRQRGLAEGNLKELFAEEIRKSWEEYSEQVGDEIASSTSYFTEALNEILSEGRQLFG